MLTANNATDVIKVVFYWVGQVLPKHFYMQAPIIIIGPMYIQSYDKFLVYGSSYRS